MGPLISALNKLRDAEKLGAFAGARILTQSEAGAVLDALDLITRVVEANGIALETELAALLREVDKALSVTR